MSFVHEYNKNRYGTKLDEFAWHNKILTNRLRFISLFVNMKQNDQMLAMPYSSKTLANRQTPALRKERTPQKKPVKL